MRSSINCFLFLLFVRPTFNYFVVVEGGKNNFCLSLSLRYILVRLNKRISIIFLLKCLFIIKYVCGSITPVKGVRVPYSFVCRKKFLSSNNIFLLRVKCLQDRVMSQGKKGESGKSKG